MAKRINRGKVKKYIFNFQKQLISIHKNVSNQLKSLNKSIFSKKLLRTVLIQNMSYVYNKMSNKVKNLKLYPIFAKNPWRSC